MLEKLERQAVNLSALENLFESAGQPLTEEEREYAKAVGLIAADDVAETVEEEEVVEEVDEDEVEVDEPIETPEVDAEDDDEPELEDEEDDAPEPEPVKAEPKRKPKQKLSKEQMRIIEQKRLIKEQANKLAEYERKARLAELQDEYGKTMDADTASVMAQSGYELERMKQELAVTRLIAQHRDTLARYDVLDEAEDIMARAKAADMTIAEYCRGKYGEVEPLQVARQKAAATGRLTNQSDESDFAVAKAQQQSESREQAKLTSEDRALMARLEKAGFANITAEEMKNVRRGL